MRSQFRTVAITAIVALAMAACDGGSSPPPAPTVTLTSSATDVGVPGPPVTLTWSSTHATSCTASGDWPQQEPWDHQLGTWGSQGFVVTQTSTYTISCSGRGGVATTSVTIRAWRPPTASIVADPTRVVSNATVLLTWSAPDAKTCRGMAGLSGTLPTSGSQTSAPLTETTTFAIECANPFFGAATSTVVVTVVVPRFTVFELPMDSAYGLNDAGDVAGSRPSGSNSLDVVAWIEGRIVDVRVCRGPPCPPSYTPWAINAARTVIGTFRYQGNYFYSFVWHSGDDSNPAQDGANSAFLGFNDINDAGQIVGSEGALGRAVLITEGTVIRLSDFYSSANAINAAGHIAGSVSAAADGKRHLFLYVDGAMQDLGTMGGGDCYPTGINATNAIVGWEDRLGGSRAFLYANSRFTDLGSLGSAASRANGINDAGQIVGTAGPVYGPWRAFLYFNGTMHDLNDLT